MSKAKIKKNKNSIQHIGLNIVNVNVLTLLHIYYSCYNNIHARMFIVIFMSNIAVFIRSLHYCDNHNKTPQKAYLRNMKLTTPLNIQFTG